MVRMTRLIVELFEKYSILTELCTLGVLGTLCVSLITGVIKGIERTQRDDEK